MSSPDHQEAALAPTPLLSEAEHGESEAQFRELIAHLKQAFWVKNAEDTAVLYVSRAYEKIWGRSRSSLYDNSHNFLDSVHPEDSARVAEAMNRKRENAGYDEEYRIVRPDGTMRWIWARTYPVYDEHGQVRRYAGIAEDISERKWSEKERLRLAAIIEHSEDSIVSITLDGVIISWNRGAERKYGYTAEEIIGRSISSLIPPEHGREYQEVMKKVRKGEPVAAYDTVRRRKDGALINLSVGIAPIEALDGEIVGVSKIGQDITRVKKLEAQLIEAQKMEVLGQLTGGVAHDFNNILSVILGYSEMMIEGLSPGHPLREQLLAIRHAAERGAGLTQQLLVFSRKETIQPVLLDLNEVLANMDSMMRRLIDEGTELTVTPGIAVGRIKADPGYVEQVLMNLVINARDAMPGGGKLFIASSNVTWGESQKAEYPDVACGEYVMISIQDTGTGMSDDIKARLFEPFYTTKPKNKGTGLGLATCKTIIQRSGGHICLQSEVGKGTTFRIYFPRVDLQPQPPTHTLRPWPLPRGSESILVVEDDPDVRRLVCAMLQGQGYDVLAAANGEDGLRSVFNRKGPPICLVISDVVMPHMGGKAMVSELETRNPDLKFFFTSGYTDDVIAHHGVLDPGIAFLSKPYTIATIARKVRDLLDAPV